MNKKNHTPAPWIHDKRAFGFEIKREFVDAGRKWLEEATAQGQLF